MLRAYGGLPPDAVLVYNKKINAYKYNATTNEIKAVYPVMSQVQYTRYLDGKPVVGKGGHISVSLGENGELLELYKIWRTVENSGNVPIIPVTDALQKLIQGEIIDSPSEITGINITKIRLGYYEKGLNESQEILEPVWVFYGSLSSDDPVMLNVYARKFANFTATPKIVSTGDTITFTDTSDASPIKWFWDFGDGRNSTLRNPTHAYQAGGNYSVSLTAWNDLGSDTLSKTEYITIYLDPKPGAGFTANYSWDNRIPPVAVSFTDTSVGYITNWSWDFGDGTNSTEQNPTHVFTLAPGEVDAFYTVNLTVTDCYGRTSMNYDWIYVQMDYHPDFTAEPLHGPAPLNVKFTDTSPTLNKIYMQIWYFGDGTYSEWYDENGGSPPRTVFHEYTADGNYSVQLSVSPIYHMEVPYSTIKDDLIHVGNVFPPDAEFTANQTSGKAPLAVDFTDQSTRSPVSWLWTFGDCTTATDQNPVHVYTTAGTYSVSLVVTNPDGSNMKMKTDYITVLPVTGTVQAGVRIEPETLNLKSKGTFTAFITLPLGYDVNNIDPASLVCEGAHAISGHATGEGSNMFIAKFDRQDLSGISPGDAVTFTVTGRIIANGDSTDFRGSDIVRVI